ncbi:hypothetical protein [Streptomyces sp. cmx-10-25]|uniref:hypothetical protein n=1 Tax=Streptomyces sp. cmx-10-25 TaxID=2790919 RepID=UPI00397F43D1
MLLVRDRRDMECLDEPAVHLNPSDDEALGFTALLGASLQTTRRSDALKMAARAWKRGWTPATTRRIAATEGLELATEPLLGTVIFRCEPTGDGTPENAAVRRKLMTDGRALLARPKLTAPDGTPQVHLKLVFLNPTTEQHEIDALLTDITTTAQHLTTKH